MAYQVTDPNDPTMQQSVDTRTRIMRMFTGGSGSGRCVANDGTEQLVSYSYSGFKNKPVIISRGDMEDVQIGVANGAGIRFDGIAATDTHQPQFRQQVGPLVAQIWQQKPILGEFGTGNYAPLDSGFLMRALCFAREFHVMGIHNNFASKPTIDLNPLWRELGYRVVLTQAAYPTTATPGSQIQFNLSWANKGTAPSYQRYPLKLYFKTQGTTNVVAQVDLPATDITQMLPPSVTATSADFLTCPVGTPPAYQSTEIITVPNLPAGTYDLAFAFVEPAYNNPIQLALTNKDAAGRYNLGSITVQSGQPTVQTSPTSTTVAPTFVPPTATAQPANTQIPPTVQPTNTSVPPTAASVLPTNTSVPAVATGLKVQYETGDGTSAINQIKARFIVVNNGTSGVQMSDLKVRYYFTRDTAQSLAFICQTAQIGCNNITGVIATMSSPLKGADYYMEVGFATGAGSLPANSRTGEIWTRINKADWSNFNQSDDYSFDATKVAYADWTKVALYYKGALVWGTTPTTVTVATNTPVPVATSTTVTVATSIPAPAVIATTPAPSGALKVQYKAGNAVITSNEVQPFFNIVNTTTTAVPLSQLTVRYYFTRDTARWMSFHCDWAKIGCANVVGRFSQLPTAVSGADFYVEVGFTSGAGSLAANSTTSDIQIRVDKDDWSNFNQSNDFSFDASKLAFADWTKVALYRNGALIWGATATSSTASSSIAPTFVPTP